MAIGKKKGSVLGIGWPWEQGSGSIPKQVTDEEAVAANLKLLFSTQPGDDKTVPQFGTDLLGFVFATVSPVLSGLVSAEVHRVASLWEPRARIGNVSVTIDEGGDGVSTLVVDVDYEYLGTSGTVSFKQSQGNVP